MKTLTFFSSVLQLNNDVTGLRCETPFIENEMLRDMDLAQQHCRPFPRQLSSSGVFLCMKKDIKTLSVSTNDCQVLFFFH